MEILESKLQQEAAAATSDDGEQPPQVDASSSSSSRDHNRAATIELIEAEAAAATEMNDQLREERAILVCKLREADAALNELQASSAAAELRLNEVWVAAVVVVVVDLKYVCVCAKKLQFGWNWVWFKLFFEFKT